MQNSENFSFCFAERKWLLIEEQIIIVFFTGTVSPITSLLSDRKKIKLLNFDSLAICIAKMETHTVGSIPE